MIFPARKSGGTASILFARRGAVRYNPLPTETAA